MLIKFSFMNFSVSDFGRLHKLAQILHSCQIEDINFRAFLSKCEQMYQTEAQKAVRRLTEKSYFTEARKFATLANIQADFVTMKQVRVCQYLFFIHVVLHVFVSIWRE